MKPIATLFVALALLLRAAAVPAQETPPPPPDNAAPAADNAAGVAAPHVADNNARPERNRFNIRPPKPSAARANRSNVYLSMDFTDVDLPVLVKFMSEQTKRNFIFDERVQGKITIISPRRVTLDEAYDIFLSVLQVKGFTTVDQGNAIKIVPLGAAKQESLSTDGAGDTAPDSEFVTRLVPLQFVDAGEMVPLLTPLVSRDGLVTAVPSTNALIVIDTRANLDRVLRILSEIDVEGTAVTLRIFPLKNAGAVEMARTLETLYQEAPAAGGAPGRVRSTRPVKTRGIPLKIIPEGRTNSLIVLTSKDLMADLEELVAKLDVPAPENTGKINVHYLENADAEEMAKVLASLAERRPGANVPVAAAAPGQPPAVARGVITAELEGGVKITADKATNSLIIVASPNDYQTLVDVIRKLDIRRRQVYVEALIMEITLNKGRDVGVEFRGAVQTGKDDGAVLTGTNFGFTGGVNDLLRAVGSGNPLLMAGSGLIAGGIAGNVTLPNGVKIPAITAILRAAQSNQNVNVLSSPHLLTLDNKDAEIIVGQNVPFISSQSRDTTNLANVINNIERRDVGITLKITPHIHESEFVSLDIFQESSAVLPESSAGLNANQVGPTTTKRSAKTSVLVRNGDMIVIGGMMQDTIRHTRSQVPILGDIPLLGHLFKFNSVSREKTNLLIFLTPHILKSPQEMTGIAVEKQKAMDRFIEQNRGEVERIIPDRSYAPPGATK